MAKYIAETLCIASIYPGKLEPIRRHYGPTRESVGRKAVRSTLFELQPVPRGGKPFILTVEDSFEEVLDVMQIQNSTAGSIQKPRGIRPVPVENIVEDLIARWTGGIFMDGLPQGAGPGIIKINGTVPTKAELDELMERQTIYFETMFAIGERHNQQNNWKDINDVMRLAAEWLGHKRVWSHRAISADSGPCPLCKAMVENDAYVCGSCGKVIRAMPPELAALNSIPTGARQ